MCILVSGSSGSPRFPWLVGGCPAGFGSLGRWLGSLRGAHFALFFPFAGPAVHGAMAPVGVDFLFWLSGSGLLFGPRAAGGLVAVAGGGALDVWFRPDRVMFGPRAGALEF